MRRFVPLLALALVVVTAQPSAAQRTGGVLKAGMIGEPPSLDIHWTTAVITQQITWHAVETLYTYDRVFNVVPMLAEGHTVADGGRRYTIRLRKGVKFHTGKEMTSADVVASLMRWGKMAGTGKAMWKNVEAVEAKDPLTVVIHMKQPSGVLLAALARPNNGAAIFPKEIVDAAGENQIKEPVGTGPFRFVEHKPDRHIKLARFKEYVARSEAPDGFGHKDFYRLDPGLLYVEQTGWHTKSGGEAYNQHSRAKTQKLLKEAGYAGQPVRWVTTQEYQWMYKNALVSKQQLEEAGFRVDLQVVDWATLVQRRNKPELWDVFSTGFTFTHEPAFATAVDCNWPGWWCQEEKNRLMESMLTELDPKRRRAIWERVQVLFYEDVGRIKFGDYFPLDVLRKEMRGFQPSPELFLWNVWLDK